jgi:hypothetical protein
MTRLDSKAVAEVIDKQRGRDSSIPEPLTRALADLEKHRAFNYADYHVESDDSHCSSSFVHMLIEMLQSYDLDARNSAADVLVELAKHGEHSNNGIKWSLMKNQTVRVAPCWNRMLL